MAVDEQTVRHIAKLAKLEFKDEELHEFTKEIDDIIETMEKLENLDAENVPGTYHGITLDSVFREDIPEKNTNKDELLNNVKNKKDGFIEVPAMLNNGEGDE